MIKFFLFYRFSKCEDFKDLGRLAWISGIATTVIHLSGTVEKLRNSMSQLLQFLTGLAQILRGICIHYY